MKKYQKLLIIIYFFIFSSNAFSKVINDSWYVMQSGSTPWGYFHEFIEEKEKKYFYRYQMTKIESNQIYEETIGAIAEEDLTPITFNLTKSGQGATESINGTFQKKSDKYGIMTITITGNRSLTIKPTLRKGSILEVMFPIHLSKNWAELKNGYKGRVDALTEDEIAGDFKVRTINYKVLGNSKTENCKEIEVSYSNIKSVWCIQENGKTIYMNFNDHQISVKKVPSEKDAKNFLQNVTKSKSNKK
jgi:hypothetical protein